MPANDIQATERRLSLLWRTILLLTVCVIIAQVCLYIWIQHSVNGHFEQMDSEILTHSAFNLRQRMTSDVLELQSRDYAYNSSIDDKDTKYQGLNSQSLDSTTLDYDIKTVIANKNGQLITSQPTDFVEAFSTTHSIIKLWQQHYEQPFNLQLDNRHYRAIIIKQAERLALIALPIDVHHHYLVQFNRQLILILSAITLLLVSIAALSVYLGFAPLSTISHKMTRIDAENLNDRIVVSDMPGELRPLADAYNAMMDKLEHNFDSLSRFSDDIAHELRTPLATLSTQTQVMLSKPRDLVEYVEQLHHQHDTLEQLSNLINNMLLLAKTQKGLYHSQLNRIDTDTLLTKLINYYEMIAEERGISFKKTGNFKEVLGDESLLQRLFANLISNAIYYASSDSIITVATSSTSSTVEITISNYLEESLTQSEAEKLFERFYRHDKDNRWHSGTGLGLSIVQAIAYAHNGKVSITIKNNNCFQISVRLSIV